MRAFDPTVSPYIYLNPSEIVVSEIRHTFSIGSDHGGLEAWGHLRTDQMRSMRDTYLFPALLAEPKMYRLAYTDDAGRWQAEGTVRRESPAPEIMRQIGEIMAVREEMQR